MPGAAVVWQVGAQQLDAVRRHEPGQLPVRLGVGAVAAAGDQRPLVQPAEVAAVGVAAPYSRPTTGTPAASSSGASASGSLARMGFGSAAGSHPRRS